MRPDPRLRRRARRHDAGFTLLEVVVALTLMSVLALVLSGSLSFGNRVWEHTSRATRSSGDTISTYQFLESSFGHVAKSPPGSEEIHKNPDFIGTSQEVSFRTSGFAQVGTAGARLIRLRLVADRLQVSLPLADGETAEGQPSSGDFILLSAIQSLAIAYRGYHDDHRDTGWVSEWQEEDSMPVLVRLSFEKASDGNHAWFFRLPERDQ